MRRRHTRVAAAVTALVAGGLAVFALRPTPSRTATLAASSQPAEIRTVVIRRTIHIVKHKPVLNPAGASGGGRQPLHGATVHTGPSGSHSYASSAAGAVSTHVSGSHTVGGAPSSYSSSSATTRTSPGHSAPTSSSGSSGTPVTSRTTPHGGSTHSGSRSGSSGGPVTSRTTPHGGSTGSGGSVKTRSSGGGEKEKGDGGGE